MVIVLTSFFAAGIPRPKGSKRHVGGGRMIESSKHLKGWEDEVARCAREAYSGDQLVGPLTVSVVFVFPRPKRLREDEVAAPHTSPSDLDKLQRAVGDALTSSEIIKDDAQINTWHAHKRRAEPGETPGARITLDPA